MTTKRNALYYVENIRNIVAALVTDRYVGQLIKGHVKIALYECDPNERRNVFEDLQRLVQQRLIDEATGDGVTIEFNDCGDYITLKDGKSTYYIKVSQILLGGCAVVGIGHWRG